MLIDRRWLMICKVPDALPRLVNVWGSRCRLHVDSMLEAAFSCAYWGLSQTTRPMLSFTFCYQSSLNWSRIHDKQVVVVEMQVIMISIYRHTASANAHPIPNSHLCHRYRESLG